MRLLPSHLELGGDLGDGLGRVKGLALVEGVEHLRDGRAELLLDRAGLRGSGRREKGSDSQAP